MTDSWRISPGDLLARILERSHDPSVQARLEGRLGSSDGEMLTLSGALAVLEEVAGWSPRLAVQTRFLRAGLILESSQTAGKAPPA